MDGFDAAKEKKWIMSKGNPATACPRCASAVASDWTEVHPAA